MISTRMYRVHINNPAYSKVLHHIIHHHYSFLSAVHKKLINMDPFSRNLLFVIFLNWSLLLGILGKVNGQSAGFQGVAKTSCYSFSACQNNSAITCQGDCADTGLPLLGNPLNLIPPVKAAPCSPNPLSYMHTAGSMAFCTCPNEAACSSGTCGIKYCKRNVTDVPYYKSSACGNDKLCCPTELLEWCPIATWGTQATAFLEPADFDNKPEPAPACLCNQNSAGIAQSRYCVVNKCSDPGAIFICADKRVINGDGPCPPSRPVCCDVSSLVICGTPLAASIEVQG